MGEKNKYTKLEREMDIITERVFLHSWENEKYKWMKINHWFPSTILCAEDTVVNEIKLLSSNFTFIWLFD